MTVKQECEFARRFMAIQKARRSGTYFDAQGEYIDGVLDALSWVLGKNKPPMPWIKDAESKRKDQSK